MAGLNPFDAPKASGGANPFDAPKKGGQGEPNPFEVGAKKAGGVLATGASTLGKALDAPGWSIRRLLTGESDTDKQMTKERSALGLEGAYQAVGKTPGVGHFLQGTADTLLQTAQDPLLALGPVAKGLGLGAKAAGLLEKTAPGRILEDATMWGAKVGRAHGPEAREVARAASNIGKSTERDISTRMERMIGKVRGSLNDEEKLQVDRALNGEIETSALSPKLLRAHNQLRRVTDLDYSLRTGVKPKDYNIGLDAPYYEKYMPGVHPKSLEYENRAATSYNRLDPFDPRTKERLPFKVEGAAAGDQGFAAMAKNTGRQVGAQKIRTALGDLADSPEVQKLFDVKLPGKGTGRTEWEKVGSGIKSVVGYPRAAIVSLTPRHAGNILNLLANTDPGALPEAMNLARKLIVADDKAYGRLVRPGTEMGAISGDFIERKPFFKDVPGLGKWTTAMNKITWAVDDAAKTVYAKRIAAKSAPKEPVGENLFRFQQTPGKAEFSPERQGTFYAMGEDAKRGFGSYERSSGTHPSVGGPNLVKDTFAPTNPLDLGEGWGGVGESVLQKFLPNEFPAIKKAAKEMARGEYDPHNNALDAFAKRMGLSERDVDAISGDYHTIMDRLGGEVARQQGHDAIILRGAKQGGTDQFVRLYKAGESSGEKLRDAKLRSSRLAAGGRASRELVDYANVAPITEAARYVAPFATFRTSIPGAVAGGVARNPARAAFLNRATGGTMYGGDTDTPWGKMKLYNPSADIGRMDPQGYARGSLGDVPRMVLNQTGMAPPSKTGRAQKDWWTYGEGLFPFKDHNGRWHVGSLADYATAGLPLGGDILEEAGVGPFRPKGIQKDIMQRVFGIGLR